jgi:hypothetical protein
MLTKSRDIHFQYEIKPDSLGLGFGTKTGIKLGLKLGPKYYGSLPGYLFLAGAGGKFFR